MKNLFVRTLLLAAFFAAAATAFGADTTTHTLQKGETLYSISRQYKVPYEALISANGISDPTKLKIGTVLVIPSVHVVEKGETLFGLSRLYGITVPELLAANKLSQSYVLKIGDTLVIPAKKADSGPAVSSTTAQTTLPAAVPATSPTATVPPAASQPTSTTTPPVTVPQTSAISTSSTLPAATTTTVATAVTNGTAFMTGTITTQQPALKPQVPSIPMPEPVKTQNKTVDMSLGWPAAGKAMYLDGKLEGIMILARTGDPAKAVAGGTVVSAGPSRGFSQVVFVQAKSGYVYVYGGNSTLLVKTGDTVVSGKELGRIGVDAADGASKAFFFVFRNGQPIDPALAPRD